MDIKNGKYWDQSWNPLKVKGGGYHCTKCSPGCDHCWAEKYNLRNLRSTGQPYDNRPVEYVLDEKVLRQPLQRRKPTVYFVCDLCDLFHPQVPFSFIHQIWDIMKAAEQHRFLVLTKRAERMLDVVDKIYSLERLGWAKGFWTHVYPGLTICNQDELYKVEQFLQIPGHKWLSIEPCLGLIDLHLPVKPIYGSKICYLCNGKLTEPTGFISQVIVGGESGAKARPMHPDRPRSIRDQCEAAGAVNELTLLV